MTAIADQPAASTLEERYPVPEGKTGIMHELNRHGDTAYFWNAGDRDEVSAARAHFDEMKRKGFIAYTSEGKDGHRGSVITKFDPKAERIIFVKQHQGGAE